MTVTATDVLVRPAAAGPSRMRPRSLLSRAVGRVTGAPLWAHVLGLVVVLALAAPFVRVGTGFTVDEGSYGVQQRALAGGGFAYRWGGTGADPAGRWFPLVSTTTTERGRFPYITHPAYPVALRTAARVLGERAGLAVLPLAGALGTAIAAWLLAGMVDDRLRAAAFWTAAVSPVLVNGWVLWAHAPSAAVGGACVVAVLHAARRPKVQSVAFAAAVGLTVAGALLRSENVLLGSGAGIAFVLMRWGSGRRLTAVAGGTVIAAAGVVTTFVEARWIASVVGVTRQVAGVRREGAPLLTGRVTGAFHSVLTPSTGSGGADFVFLVAAVLLVLVVVYRPRAFLVAAAGGVVATIVAALVFVSPTRPLTGLLAAWPLVLPGFGALVAGAGRDGRSREERAIIAAVGALAAGVLASQYDGGGGIEWGGRFFSPALAPLAVLAVIGGRRLLDRTIGNRRVVAATLGVLAVVPAVAGLVVVGARHRAVTAANAEVLATRPSVVVTHSDSLVRNAWRSQPGVTWFLVPPGEVGQALTALRAAGVTRVTLVEPADLPAGSLDAAVRTQRVHAPMATSAGRAILNIYLR